MGDSPFRPKNLKIGYPLHGKKHSSLLGKEEFAKILEKDKDYQHIVDLERKITEVVSAAHKRNREIKARIAALWRQVIQNDKKVWGQARIKQLRYHQRRTVALRIYRHELARRLSADSQSGWVQQYDKSEEITEEVASSYEKELEGLRVDELMAQNNDYGGLGDDDGDTS